MLVSEVASWIIALSASGYFLYLLGFAGLTVEERRRVHVMMALFCACAIFISGLEQGGVSLNLFADRYTDRHVFRWEIPAGVLQGTTALFVIVFGPLFAALWLALGKRGKDPSAPAKFSLGLLLLGLGFCVMALASQQVIATGKVGLTWLILSYLLQEWGDLCLSPVGLSAMTKLAPQQFVGQVMGLWFLAIALGNNLAGRLAGEYDACNLQSLPHLFTKIVVWCVITAVILLALTPILKRWANRSHGIPAE